jgi:iron complex transport system substrate-binding protein
VFYQVWPQPLITLNGEHLISQVLDVCGADNVFAAQRLLTPTVTEEAVLLADPDAIVTGWIPAYGGTAPLEAWHRLSALRAGAHRPVADGESRSAAPPIRPRGARCAGAV